MRGLCAPSLSTLDAHAAPHRLLTLSSAVCLSLPVAQAGPVIVGVIVLGVIGLTAYIVLRYGCGKFSLWWRYHTSHSKVTMRWGYRPREDREEMAEVLYGREKTAPDEVYATEAERDRKESALGVQIDPNEATDADLEADVRAEIEELKASASSKGLVLAADE